MNHEQLNDFARRYTAAWCSQKPSSVAGFFSERGSLKINEAAPAVGRAAITASAQAFMTGYPDMIVVMDTVKRVGDRVQYHWTFTGKNTGAGGTGRFVRQSGYEDWQFGADGLVAESLGHYDAAAWQRQVDGK